MARKTVVISVFPDEIAADDAVAALKDWDKADDDIKLNAIGILVADENGKVKAHKLGRRSVGKGAGIGLLLAAIAPPDADRRGRRRSGRGCVPSQGSWPQRSGP